MKYSTWTLSPAVPTLGGVSVADEGAEIYVRWKPTSLPTVTGEFSHVCETLLSRWISGGFPPAWLATQMGELQETPQRILIGNKGWNRKLRRQHVRKWCPDSETCYAENRLPREVVEALSLGVFKMRQNKALVSVRWGISWHLPEDTGWPNRILHPSTSLSLNSV